MLRTLARTAGPHARSAAHAGRQLQGQRDGQGHTQRRERQLHQEAHGQPRPCRRARHLVQQQGEQLRHHRPEEQRAMLAVYGHQRHPRTSQGPHGHEELPLLAGLHFLLRPAGEEQPLPARHHRHARETARRQDGGVALPKPAERRGTVHRRVRPD